MKIVFLSSCSFRENLNKYRNHNFKAGQRNRSNLGRLDKLQLILNVPIKNVIDLQAGTSQSS
jgi:hypothetical protein